MNRMLSVIAGLVGVLALGVGAILLWGDSSRRSGAKLERQTTYAVPSAPADRDTFTVMTYNLGFGSDLPSDASADGTPPSAGERMDEAIDLIREVSPDVVGIQEIALGAARPGPVPPLDTIAPRLGFMAAGRATGRDDRYALPFWEASTASGQALLSRFPLRRHVRRELPRSAQSFWEGWLSPSSLLQVTAVDIGGWPLLVMNARLHASDVGVREEQARVVSRFYRRLAQQGFPIVLIGSLNSVMPATLPASSSDDTMEILLRGTGLQPALSPEGARLTGRSVATYPAPDPDYKVDYIFYRPRLVAPIDATTHCGDASPPSRHCAVSMSFFLPRPLDELPEKRIPDDELPSLDSLMAS